MSDLLKIATRVEMKDLLDQRVDKADTSISKQCSASSTMSLRASGQDKKKQLSTKVKDNAEAVVTDPENGSQSEFTSLDLCFSVHYIEWYKVYCREDGRTHSVHENRERGLRNV